MDIDPGLYPGAGIMREQGIEEHDPYFLWTDGTRDNVAIGRDADASYHGIAIGKNSSALFGSIAIGTGASATDESIAIGPCKAENGDVVIQTTNIHGRVIINGIDIRELQENYEKLKKMVEALWDAPGMPGANQIEAELDEL